jgi:hypothetical protein
MSAMAPAAAIYQTVSAGGGMLSPQQQMILDSFDVETYIAGKIDVQAEPIWDSIAFSNGAQAAGPVIGAPLYNSTGYPVGWTGSIPNGHTAGTADTMTPGTNTDFFVNVGAGSGKTVAQCGYFNSSARLAAPEAFAIFAFRLFWNESIAYSDLETILNNFAFTFVIGRKDYQTGPLRVFGSGGGIAGVTSASTTSILTNGEAGRQAMHKLAIPLVIENQASFYGRLLGNAYQVLTAANGGTGIMLQLACDGLHARGVQ